MNTNELILKLAIIALLALITVVIVRISILILKDLSELKSIKNKELENDKLKLYSTIDPKVVREELNDLIRQYVARYMTKNILVNQVTFIKNDQVDTMVKDIIKDVVINMSDLYLSYCKLLYNISNQEDLTEVIYFLTVDIVLDTVTSFNGSSQE